MSMIVRPALMAGYRGVLAASASVVAFAVAGAAFAQDDAGEAVPAPAAEDAARQRDEITVTGSRIRRDEFSSAVPIQVIDPELGALGGTFDTGSLIQSSSVAAGSARSKRIRSTRT